MSGKQTVIITGASRGIGAGLVHGFLEKGYNVVATSRHAKQELAISDSLVLLDGDVSQQRTADDVVEAANQELRNHRCFGEQRRNLPHQAFH